MTPADLQNALCPNADASSISRTVVNLDVTPHPRRERMVSGRRFARSAVRLIAACLGTLAAEAAGLAEEPVLNGLHPRITSPLPLAQDTPPGVMPDASQNWQWTATEPNWLAEQDKPPVGDGAHSERRRGTLMQWSYGNSFSGGPDLDEPITTDRPDFTENSVTVGKDVVQIEFGYTYTFDRENGTSITQHSMGEPLLRYGIFADWLEFRVALFPIEMRESGGGTRTSTAGTEDLYLGFKLALTPQEGILPEMALTPQMTVPTGSNAFTNDEVLAGLNWLYGWDVTERLSAAGSTQFNRARDDTGEYYMEFAQSLTTGLAISENVGAYAEWFALFPTSANEAPTEHYFNGGLTFLFNNDAQLDIRAGTGLNSSAADFFAGIGLSLRFH